MTFGVWWKHQGGVVTIFFVHGFIYALWSLRKREQNENAKRETERETDEGHTVNVKH